MRLRATAGAYAGHVREYSFSAGQAALQTGTAERLDPIVAPATAVVIAPPVPVQADATKRRRDTRFAGNRRA